MSGELPGERPPPDPSVSDHDTRARVIDFYDAYRQRDAERLDAIIDDRIDWLLAGPVEQLDFCGARHGKAEVMELILRVMPRYFDVSQFEFSHVLVEGERAAVHGRIRARQRATDRAIRYGFAHFLRFQNGKLAALRGVGDTFDLVEQVVGHTIDVSKDTDSAARETGDGVRKI